MSAVDKTTSRKSSKSPSKAFSKVSSKSSSATSNGSLSEASFGSANANRDDSVVLRLSQKQNTPSSPKKSPKRESPKRESPKRESPKRESPKRESPKRESPKQSPKQKVHISMPPSYEKPVYLDADGNTNPQLYYNQPFFTRRPVLVSRDTILPNLDNDEDNEYLFLPTHGEIGRLLSAGNLISDPSDPTGKKKLSELDEQRQINHYLRIIEISTPHEMFGPINIKSLITNIHDELTSSNNKKLFSASSVGKQERLKFFKKIKPFLKSPNPTVDSVHLVDLTHDRLFCGHVDITLISKSIDITFNHLTGGQNYMSLLKPIRPAEFDQNPNITEIEKDAFETFKLYEDAQWFGAPDGVNIDRLSLFDTILSLAQTMKKRLNIVIISCSGPLDPYNQVNPFSQPFYFNTEMALLTPHNESMYKEPIKILKTGCDYINRMAFILNKIVYIEHEFKLFFIVPDPFNSDVRIITLYNAVTKLINNLFSNGLYDSIISCYSIYYITMDLLLFKHNNQNIFISTSDIDDFELLLFGTKIYLAQEICKQLIGLIENVITILDTTIKINSDIIIRATSTDIWRKSISQLGLQNQIFNRMEYVNFFSSVGQAVEYLYYHITLLKTTYLEPLLQVLKSTEKNINMIQDNLKVSNSVSTGKSTIAYRAVKLANQRKVVFENLVKKHCSHHYKYKSRTPNDVDNVTYKSTRSHRVNSLRKKSIGALQKGDDPLYKNSDTIKRNKKVKDALNLLDVPLNEKIVKVLGPDNKDRNMSRSRIERNKPDGVFMRNRIQAFGNMLSKETRKKISSKKRRTSKNSTGRKEKNHSV